MKRAILAPALLAGTALDELKQWLAISISGEDALLTALLRTGLEMCEAFTGTMPLECLCEEQLPASGEWQRLATLPVQSITGVDAIPAEGARYALAPDDYAIELEADGAGLVRAIRQGNAGRIAVRFTAGLAPDWGSLPESLRHGIIRLAAHHYREREGTPGVSPPAAVAALWHPWRQVRLL